MHFTSANNTYWMLCMYVCMCVCDDDVGFQCCLSHMYVFSDYPFTTIML